MSKIRKRTIYVVTEGSYDDYHIEGIFSKREDAQNFSIQVKGEVEEWTLDEKDGWIKRTQYICNIDLKSGEILHEWHHKIEAPPKVRTAVGIMDESGKASFCSYVSKEHARKLAQASSKKYMKGKSHGRKGT